MKLIYIFATRVLALYEKEFGISYFRNKGWEIEIFDMSPIITPAAYKRIESGIYAGSDMRIFHSRNEYRKYIRTLKEGSIFICHDFNRLNTRFLFSCLRKNHIHGFLWTGSSTTIVKENTEEIVKRDLKKIVNSIYIRLPHIIQKVPPAGFIAMSLGEEHERLKDLAYKNKNTIVKYVQGNDFEQYLQVKNKDERLISEKYCVFIDEYMGYHPDMEDINVSYTQEDIKLYYTEIKKFFHHVENYMGLKVVIALHPRADFSRHPECYEGFTAIRFKTAELIKYSEFVMTHYSEALSYVILFHKPCISIEPTMIKKTHYMSYHMKLMQKQFHLQTIDISNEEYRHLRLQDYLKVDNSFWDECIRKYYYKDYINENTIVKSLWEQVEECINNAVKIKFNIEDVM